MTVPLAERLASDRSARIRRRLLLGLALAAGLAAAGVFMTTMFRPAPPTKSVAAPPAPPPPLRLSLGKRQTLQDVLGGQGMVREDAARLTRALGQHLNLRRLRPDDAIELHRDPGGEIARLVYTQSPIEIYEASRAEDGWNASRREVPIERRVVRVAGVLRDNLFESMESAGERPQLVGEFADIFAWDFDFAQDSQPGDRFSLVVEKVYTGETFVKYGRILAAEYDNQGRRHTGISFKDQQGSGYYTPAGESLRRSFLKSPLEFTRISSRFSRARRHPVLGGVRPHLAVDYAAPSGTPVMAVADGTVEYAGWKGGNGITVLLRHRANFKTMYNHLSAAAKGIHPGATVRQRQVIGYVGSTGLSTGPHLDYRVMREGKFVNPLTQTFLPGQPIAAAARAAYAECRDALLRRLRDEPASPAPAAPQP
jgi:murein DD-endopeptidase MepM/ murein hydrolase activator NlpD